MTTFWGVGSSWKKEKKKMFSDCCKKKKKVIQVLCFSDTSYLSIFGFWGLVRRINSASKVFFFVA